MIKIDKKIESVEEILNQCTVEIKPIKNLKHTELVSVFSNYIAIHEMFNDFKNYYFNSNEKMDDLELLSIVNNFERKSKTLLSIIVSASNHFNGN